MSTRYQIATGNIPSDKEKHDERKRILKKTMSYASKKTREACLQYIGENRENRLLLEIFTPTEKRTYQIRNLTVMEPNGISFIIASLFEVEPYKSNICLTFRICNEKIGNSTLTPNIHPELYPVERDTINSVDLSEWESNQTVMFGLRTVDMEPIRAILRENRNG